MMNRLRLLTGSAMLLLTGMLVAGVPGVKLPAYKKATLKNGMTVVLMEQHKVPLVDLQLVMKAGTTQDPKGKEGLASLTANLLRKGTRTRTADQISTALDAVGGHYAAAAGLDESVCTAEFMAKDIGNGLDLVADMVTQPTFPEAEVLKLRAQRLDGIRTAKDSAQGVIRTYFSAFLYGEHPYGRPQNGDERSLAGLTQADVAAFHAANYTPGNTILVVVGDFKTDDMEKLVAQRFESWRPAGKASRVELGSPHPPSGRRLLLIDKPDATQTYFMIGNLGVARSNPDRVAIMLVNVVFGERFTSMINTALRIKSGLTYGASSEFPMHLKPGPFAINSFTANATTGKALDLALQTLRDLHEKGISEADLASAKAYIKGTLPPKTLETGQQLAAVLADLQFYGLPDSEVDGFFRKVDAVTLADTRRIIQSYYPDRDLCFVLIGKANEIRPMVESFASQIVTRSVSEPGF
jgi:predicted Zn-dependent peptidase